MRGWGGGGEWRRHHISVFYFYVENKIAGEGRGVVRKFVQL